MDEFPDNSKFSPAGKDAPAKKELVQITSTAATTQKKPLGTRLRETFVGGEAKSVWAYVVMDVLVPAAKDTMADAVSQGIERMLFGEARSTSRRTGYRPGGGVAHTAYNRMYGGGSPQAGLPRETAGPRTGITSRGRATHDFGEIVLPTRVDAQEVLSSMYTLLSTYEQVSVSDLYTLVGIEPTHTDNKFGWLSLDGSDIRRLRDGYALSLPRPEPI